MLIKYSPTDKRAKVNAICKQQRNAVMKGPTGGNLGPRPHRKAMKGSSSCTGGPLASKRASAPQKRLPSVGTDGIVVSRRRSEEARVIGGGGIVGALDTCDNSNDSGLGFDHPPEVQKVTSASLAHATASNSQLLHFDGQEESWDNHCTEVKRQRLGIKMERLEDGNSGDNFSVFSVNSRATSQVSTLRQTSPTVVTLLPNGSLRPVAQAKVIPSPAKSQSLKRKAAQGNAGQGSHVSGSLAPSMLLPPRGPDGNYPLTAQLPSSTLIKNDTGPPSMAQLLILAQPESQHRARYQTEGSRGAVKDRSGNGFPIVKLVGFNGPAQLQVFIGTDLGRVAPHMFYQACRVSGKNSTPCSELKVDGTILIEVEFDASKDMIVTCDCVGILKERNVDVEHRFPEQSAGRSKKKSTRCRMVFRANLKLPNGSTETLQAISQPIVCTQPPGVPEICKKSLTGCGCGGGAELFILGKNFLKDTRVVFRLGRNDSDDGGGGSASDEDDGDCGESSWEEQVIPDREFLQPTHLVCVVPPYRRQDISSPVQVRLLVTSSGKKSEAHAFTYTPEGHPSSTLPQASLANALVSSRGCRVSPTIPATPPTTPLSSPTQIAPTMCSLGPVSSSSIVVSSEASGDSMCDGKLAVTLIAPAVGGVALSTAANQHTDHIRQSIPLNIEVNSHFTKVEPAELPVTSAGVNESTGTNSGVTGLPTLGRPFISCHSVATSQGVAVSKEGVHPVVLWSTEGSAGTEVIKVLSAPLQITSSTVSSEPSVQLSLTNGLSVQRTCPGQKEAMCVSRSCLTSSATVSDDIPKTQGNLMVSSTSEANLIQQFVSNNISSPLPAQSGQSVEKFLSRIEGEQKPSLPITSVKVETSQPLSSEEELPLKTSTVVSHSDVASSTVAQSLPSNLVMQFATIMQNQSIDQKIAEQQVASVPSDNPTAVSPHTLVLESLSHSMSGVLTNSSPSETTSTTQSVVDNQAESGNVPSSTACGITFVKPLQDQTLPSIPISNDICSHNIVNSIAVTSAKICPKEELDICGISLGSNMSSNPIPAEVRNDDIPQTIEQNCMMTIQDPPISLAVPMEQTCSLTSDAIAVALTEGSLGAASQQPISQALPQLNLEDDNPIPIVSSAAILHDVMAPSAVPSTQKEPITDLNHGCGTISPNDSISLGVSNPVTNVELVKSLEHNMTVQSNNLQLGSGMVNNACTMDGSQSNENIATQCQNLSIENPATAMSNPQIEVCQSMLQPVDKDACRPENIPLTNMHSVTFPVLRLPVHPLARKDIEDQQRAQIRVAAAMQRVLKEEIPQERILPPEVVVSPVLSQASTQPQLQLAVTVGPRKCGEDGGMVPQELTQMSDHDLLSYINPSCFDQV